MINVDEIAAEISDGYSAMVEVLHRHNEITEGDRRPLQPEEEALARQAVDLMAPLVSALLRAEAARIDMEGLL